MTFATVFGGGIALQRVGWELWFWQLGACVLSAICKSHASIAFLSEPLADHLEVVWFWCPETAGRSLEEIDLVFSEESKKWPGIYLGKEKLSEDMEKSSQEDTTHMEKV